MEVCSFTGVYKGCVWGGSGKELQFSIRQADASLWRVLNVSAKKIRYYSVDNGSRCFFSQGVKKLKHLGDLKSSDKSYVWRRYILLFLKWHIPTNTLELPVHISCRFSTHVISFSLPGPELLFSPTWCSLGFLVHPAEHIGVTLSWRPYPTGPVVLPS